MALTPFPSVVGGDPAALHRAIAPQPTAGLPVDEVTATYRDFVSFGGAIPLTRGVIDRQAFSTAGEEKTPLRGKMDLPASSIRLGDVDPGDYGLLHFLVNYFGKYVQGNAPSSASVKRWQMDRLQTASTASRYLSMKEHDDINPAKRFHDIRVGGVTISASPNENLSVAVNIGAGGYSFGGVVVQETGTGSTLPILRRTWPGNFALDAADQDIWVEIQVDNADGTYDVRVGISSSGAAPIYSDVRVLTEGEWFKLFDTDGSRIGVKAEQPEIFFPVGATLTALDEFRIPKRRANWAETLPTSRAISSVSASLLIDGDEIKVEGGWELTLGSETFENVPDTAYQQGHTVRLRGARTARLTLTREIEDSTIQQKLHEAQVVSAVIDAETEVLIGATIYPWRMTILLPSLIPEGPMYAVNEGATEAQENPTFRAGEPSSTFTYEAESGDMSTDAAVSIILENELTAL